MKAQSMGRLARLGHFTARYRWPVIAAWIVLTLFGGYAAGQLSSRWYQSLAVPGKPAYEASQYDSGLGSDFHKSHAPDLATYAVSDNLGSGLVLLLMIPTVAFALGSLSARFAAATRRI